MTNEQTFAAEDNLRQVVAILRDKAERRSWLTTLSADTVSAAANRLRHMMHRANA